MAMRVAFSVLCLHLVRLMTKISSIISEVVSLRRTEKGSEGVLINLVGCIPLIGTDFFGQI